MGKLNPPKKQLGPAPKLFHILVYADFNCTTGFGIVAKELIDNWKTKLGTNIKIHIFALNDYSEKPYNYAPGVKVYPAKIMPYGDPTDMHHRRAFLSLLQGISYNVVYFLHDIEVVGSFAPELRKINVIKKGKKELQFKSIYYFPIDSPIRKADLGILEYFDELITYTKYGESFIKENAPQKCADKIQIIPHGVNQTQFKKLPASEILSIKEAKFGKDKFVIGTVNRNSARKDLSNLLLAFTELKRQYRNVPIINDTLILYLHCNPLDPFGVNMKYLCSKLGLEEGKDVFFPKDYSENKGYSTAELNELYNCMDVFVSTSTSEGWGLTVTEAMASETLVIAPLHTSLEELCADKETGELRVIAIQPNELEPVIFVNDGNKVRYKTPLKVLVERLHWSIDSETQGAKEQLIKNAKESLNQYSWTESAEKFWAIISKYLK